MFPQFEAILPVRMFSPKMMMVLLSLQPTLALAQGVHAESIRRWLGIQES